MFAELVGREIEIEVVAGLFFFPPKCVHIAWINLTEIKDLIKNTSLSLKMIFWKYLGFMNIYKEIEFLSLFSLCILLQFYFKVTDV